jgi:hypothetical protein
VSVDVDLNYRVELARTRKRVSIDVVVETLTLEPTNDCSASARVGTIGELDAILVTKADHRAASAIASSNVR